MTEDDPAFPAASLILMRERRSGPPELLIVQRSASLVFAAGAYVFPGGRVDPADYEAASRLHPALEPEDGAARIAAVRETLEETAIAVSPAEALVPFARWLPKERVKRRFDTRFYLAEAQGEAIPVADGVETASAFWAAAGDLLARCARGDGRAIFPTRRLLERLARFSRFSDARAEAERLPQRIITPWVEHRAGGDWLRIPDDAGYPITGEPVGTAMRY
ncbi:NUDIX hydrolase [Sphingomonas sp. PR090111-T3T-6A]|uniref:NUDIX hydrolase n=1 Tax=Sphingomonas sp. PR090111-T3T-6A TaxID=685778 RepID=UPI00036C54A6|nr:NUDIX domain-containing protein [Sphingomonas sp. PR090111-T3T-6A]